MEAVPPFYPSQFRTTVPRAYRRALAEGRLTADDQQLIEEFIAERQAIRHIGQHRVLKIRYDLITWRRFIPVPFRTMTAGDLYAGLNAMKTSTNARGTTFKQNTKHDLIILLKPFVLWLIENGYSAISAEKVRAIRPPPIDHNTTAPEELLSAEEVKRLLAGSGTCSGCSTTRSRGRPVPAQRSGSSSMR